MPVEIRELVIKATVNQDQNKFSSGSDAPGVKGTNEERQSIVREAVEEALRIMELIKER